MEPILGLDLSLNSTGICILTAGGPHTSLTLNPPKKLGLGLERLIWLQDSLESIVNAYGLRGRGHVFVEDYAFGGGSRKHGAGEWGGIARVLLARSALNIYTVAPTTLKAFVSGKGTSEKNQMLLAAFQKWGVTFANDDECDAYSLARLGQLVLGYAPKTAKDQKSCDAVKLLYTAPIACRIPASRIRVFG